MMRLTRAGTALHSETGMTLSDTISAIISAIINLVGLFIQLLTELGSSATGS